MMTMTTTTTTTIMMTIHDHINISIIISPENTKQISPESRDESPFHPGVAV